MSCMANGAAVYNRDIQAGHVPKRSPPSAPTSADGKAATRPQRRHTKDTLVKAGKPNATQSVAVARSLSEAIQQEKDTAATMSSALDRYKAISQEVQNFEREKADAEKAKAFASHEMYRATVQLRHAKGSMFKATKDDMRSDPLTSNEYDSREVMASLDSMDEEVTEAEEHLREADKLVRAADGDARQAGRKAVRALAVQSRLQKKLDETRKQSKELVASIAKEQKVLDLEVDEVLSTASDLENKEADIRTSLKAPANGSGKK